MNRNPKSKKLIKQLIIPVVIVIIGCLSYRAELSYADAKVLNEVALVNAVKQGDISTVELLLEKDTDPDTKSEEGEPLLIYAVWNNYADIVELLLEKGADPDIDNKENITPLTVAAFFGHTEIIKLLLRRNADSDKQGWRSALNVAGLGYAFSKADSNILGLSLLDNEMVKSYLREEVINDDTLLEIIQFSDGHVEIINLLLEAGARNFDLLMRSASLLGYSEIIEVLLNHEISLDIDDFPPLNMALIGYQWSKVINHALTSPSLLMALMGGHDEVTQLISEVIKLSRTRTGHSNIVNAMLVIGAGIMAFDSGHIEIINLLLEKGADLHIEDKLLSLTPLHYASYIGETEIIKLLLDKGANPNIETKHHTPLTITTSPVGKCNPDIEIELPFEKMTVLGNIVVDSSVLSIANAIIGLSRSQCREHQPEIVKLLLDEGADPDIAPREGISPLALASFSGYAEEVRILLEYGADPNIGEKEGVTPLMAAMTGDLSHKIVDFELKFGSLLVAVMEPFTGFVRFFYDRSVNSNEAIEDFVISLIKFTNLERGHTEIIRLLLKEGADPNIPYNAFTPLLIATISNDVEKVEILLEEGADPNIGKEGFTPLAVAAFMGNSENTRLLLENDADPNAILENNITALMMATLGDLLYKAISNRLNFISALMEGEYANKFTRSIKIPIKETTLEKIALGADEFMHSLETIIFRGDHTEVIRLLLEEGADPNLGEEGLTPLMVSVFTGHGEKVKLLLEGGADSDMVFENTAPPLMAVTLGDSLYDIATNKQLNFTSLKDRFNRLANTVIPALEKVVSDDFIISFVAVTFEDGHTEIFEVLLDNDADSNMVTKIGTPLTVAIELGRTEAVELLLDEDADPDIADEYSETPLHFAAKGGYVEITELLLDEDAYPEMRSKKTGKTPLIEAVEGGHIEIVELLLDEGADPDIPDNNNSTPLYWATKGGHTEIVELLLDEDALPDMMSNGNPPLYEAVKEGRTRIVELLLKGDADPNLENSNGITPLRAALTGGNAKIVKLLKENGAER